MKANVNVETIKTYILSLEQKLSSLAFFAVDEININSVENLKSNLHLAKKICFICFNESPIKMLKKCLKFILKALFVLKIFKVLSWLFCHVEKKAWLETKVNLKIYDVTTWLINNYNIHIAQYLTK